MTRRMIAFLTVSAFAFALSALLAASSIAAKGQCFRPDPQPGNGKSVACDVLCDPCFEPVCNSAKRCDYSCQPVPGCVR